MVDSLYAAVAGYNQIQLQNDSNDALNTAIVMGSPPLQFLACFAGLADPYFWIRGEDRAWLAGVIEHGLEIGLMRTGNGDTGWEKLIVLLREQSRLPVVTTYSGNSGPVTSMIQAGNTRRIADLLAMLEKDECGKFLRVGPDNIAVPRFRGMLHAFHKNSIAVQTAA
jgi:hypothetical protein